MPFGSSVSEPDELSLSSSSQPLCDLHVNKKQTQKMFEREEQDLYALATNMCEMATINMHGWTWLVTIFQISVKAARKRS